MTVSMDDMKSGAVTVVASVSGGKDSAAMCLYLRELGIEPVRVFADTGWEHAAAYEYLRGPLTDALGPIHEVRGDLLMRDLIVKYQMFPSRLRRYCTRELKIKPLARFFKAIEGEAVNCVGIRAAESESRSRFPEWEWSDAFDCETWRPLLRWSEQDVIDIHARHGLTPNPLYLRGASRVGCWPCIHARKEEVRLIADIDPARIDEIAALEAELSASAKSRDADATPRTFFQGQASTTPIGEVVAWSRTARGGKQLQLIQTAPEGCARWGLCDVAKDEDPPGAVG